CVRHAKLKRGDSEQHSKATINEACCSLAAGEQWHVLLGRLRGGNAGQDPSLARARSSLFSTQPCNALQRGNPLSKLATPRGRSWNGDCGAGSGRWVRPLWEGAGGGNGGGPRRVRSALRRCVARSGAAFLSPTWRPPMATARLKAWSGRPSKA